jgi:VanZ like family
MTEARPRTSATLHLVPAIAYVLAIFVAGSVPLRELPRLGFVPTDKLLHLVSFGLMQALIWNALRALRGDLAFGRQNLGAVAVTSGLGALLELWQSFIPFRSAEFLDWLADTLGALLFAALIAVVRARRSHLRDARESERSGASGGSRT